MANAALDQNSRATLIGVSSADGVTPTRAFVNPANGRLLVDLGSGGSVTSVSVVSANGFAGTVATPTTTPAITLTTSVTGLIKGNGTALSAASSGTDYSTGTSALTTGIIKSTTGTGALTIAVAGDFPTLNQSTTGNALTATTAGNVTGIVLPANGGTGIANNNSSALTISGAFATTLTVSATTALTLPTSGTVTAQGNTVTGSGSIVLATSPTLVTPILGVAAATTINKVTLTIPATGSTLTILDGKTLKIDNTLEFAGTDSTVMTFPTTSATIARTDAAQTFTGTQTFSQIVTTSNTITASGNAATVPITSRISTVTNNSAATLTITITTASAVDGMMVMVRILDFSAVAQTITWVNTENSTATAPTTSNGSTTQPLTVGFQYNAGTSKWRCIASA